MPAPGLEPTGPTSVGYSMQPRPCKSPSWFCTLPSPGQTRPPADSSDATPRVFARGLDRPEAVAPIGDDAVLVAERSGRVLLLDGVHPLRPGRDRRCRLDRVLCSGAALHRRPEGPHRSARSARRLFLVHDNWDRRGRALDRWPCEDRNGSRPACHGERGRLAIRAATVDAKQRHPRFLDAGWPPKAMTSSSPSAPTSRAVGGGRIMRISASNAHAPRVVSTGHRNPSGLVLMSGTLWEVEHGPKGGDELNIISSGQ